MFGQAGWATRAALHDRGWLFFSIGMSLGLYLFNAASQWDIDTTLNPPVELQMTAAMRAWAAMVTAMVNMSEGIARARDRRIFKRLRGTSLLIGDYFAGRFLAALAIIVATDGLMLALGSALRAGGGLERAGPGGRRTPPRRRGPRRDRAGAGVAAADQPRRHRGLAWRSRSCSRSSPNVFDIEDVPDWMSAVGAVFPLKHLANSLSYALDPTGRRWCGSRSR